MTSLNGRLGWAKYRADGPKNGANRPYLGQFDTAEEAAAAYAKHMLEVYNQRASSS